MPISPTLTVSVWLNLQIEHHKLPDRVLQANECGYRNSNQFCVLREDGQPLKLIRYQSFAQDQHFEIESV